MIQKTLTKHTPIILKNNTPPNISSTTHRSASSVDPEHHWKTALQNMITDVDVLFDRLALEDANLRARAKAAAAVFPLRVTESYLSKIAINTVTDPLLLQILPVAAEKDDHPDYNADPTGDQFAKQTTGLLHKYHGRVLLILTEACAIHCRYCFRREHPYSENTASQSEWQSILRYIEADNSIDEVILSGGDPLMLSNDKLKRLCQQLADIPHIKRLRLHTRLPIVLPTRITDALCELLADLPLEIIMVVHCNHANELDTAIADKIQLLKQHHVTVLNQAVLLAGINNTTKAQTTLSKQLFAHGILPYYLHALDQVNGTQHFAVAAAERDALYASMQRQLPGYLVPKLVQDLPKHSHKTLLPFNQAIQC